MTTRRKGEERILEAQVERYLELKGLRYIRVPDSLWATLNTTKTTQKLLLFSLAKYLAGMPDLVILKGERVLCLELKSKKGALSPNQKRWAEDVRVQIVRDFESARSLIDAFSESARDWSNMGVAE